MGHASIAGSNVVSSLWSSMEAELANICMLLQVSLLILYSQENVYMRLNWPYTKRRMVCCVTNVLFLFIVFPIQCTSILLTVECVFNEIILAML
jgi:hypothetical protein